MMARETTLVQARRVIRADDAAVLAAAAFGFAGGLTRHLLFSRRDDRLVLVDENVWLSQASIAALRDVTPIGGSDAMYATAAVHVWQGNGTFRYWNGGKLTLTMADGHVTWKNKRRALANIISAEARLDGWSKHLVNILFVDGTRWTVARKRELFATLDPTYDGFNLMADAAWAEDLAKAMADHVGRPFVSKIMSDD